MYTTPLAGTFQNNKHAYFIECNSWSDAVDAADFILICLLVCRRAITSELQICKGRLMTLMRTHLIWNEKYASLSVSWDYWVLQEPNWSGIPTGVLFSLGGRGGVQSCTQKRLIFVHHPRNLLKPSKRNHYEQHVRSSAKGRLHLNCKYSESLVRGCLNTTITPPMRIYCFYVCWCFVSIADEQCMLRTTDLSY
jgi:hypothetical protein